MLTILFLPSTFWFLLFIMKEMNYCLPFRLPQSVASIILNHNTNDQRRLRSISLE